MKIKELVEVYEKKLRLISNTDDFVYSLTRTFVSDEEIKYMIRFIDENPSANEYDIWLENIDWINDYKSRRSVDAIVGLVVADALGVPVEFTDRKSLRENPVCDMRAYGTHNQPAGTWSDDSSMVIATMDWYVNSCENITTLDELDYKELMDKFCAWMMYGDYTPYGERFDIGIATSRALMNYGRGMEPVKCGGQSEYDNGNGSLMRILPSALFYRQDLLGEWEGEKSIYEMSALTHAHPRSMLACLIYSIIIAEMMQYEYLDKIEIVTNSMDKIKKYLKEKAPENIKEEKIHYDRLLEIDSFSNLSEDVIKSSGYVVDTLEAAVWCFLNTDSYKECVLTAVNLGEDTDTVGAVAGGLAGLYYGIKDIPEEWMEVIPKYNMIKNLAEHLLDHR